LPAELDRALFFGPAVVFGIGAGLLTRMLRRFTV